MECNYPVDPSVSTKDIYPNPDTTAYTDLIAFVHDRCKVNDGLIGSINTRKEAVGATVTLSQLRARCNVVDKTFRYPVRETTENVGIRQFIAAWRAADTEYVDTTADFPAGIKWDLDTFAKLVQANGAVRDMATTLALAEGSSKSKQVLVKLLRNATKMGEQLRQLFVLTNQTKTSAAAGETDASLDAAVRCKQLQDELESSAANILRKYGAIAEIDTPVIEAPTPSVAPVVDLPTGASAPAPSLAVQAAMSAMGVLAEHLASLLQWISEARGAPYTGDTLTLQYQASRDGWKADDFRRMCNGQGSMVFIVRSSNGYLFGGYTSVGFTQYTITKDIDSNRTNARDDAAFVFTLTNPHGIEPSKYPCKKPGFALVNCCSGFDGGLCFNWGFGLTSDCNTKTGPAGCCVMLRPDFYDTPHGAETFTGTREGWTVTDVIGFRV